MQRGISKYLKVCNLNQIQLCKFFVMYIWLNTTYTLATTGRHLTLMRIFEIDLGTDPFTIASSTLTAQRLLYTSCIVVRITRL